MCNLTITKRYRLYPATFTKQLVLGLTAFFIPRMAECRMDVKVLQYIMGHAHIDVTMEVYNHIGELTRIENEIARLDSMVLNA